MTPGRNDPCACGSGKKLKRCCGASGPISAGSPQPAAPLQAIPTIVNNDGHLLVQTASSYEVLDEECVLIEIGSWRPKPDIVVQRDRSGRISSIEAVFQRRARKTRGPGGGVLVARIAWKRGEDLLVETNSTERDLEVRGKLEMLGGDLRFLRTLGRSVADLLSGPPTEQERMKAEQEEKDLAANPEVQAQMAAMFLDYSLRWCDTTIPALGNRKPRSLVRTETGKSKVLALIEEMEDQPRPEGTGGMDFALIRKELGLPS